MCRFWHSRCAVPGQMSEGDFTMKRIFCLVLLAILAAASGGEVQGQKERVFKKLMQDKLKSSQALLEGLATNNFAKIETNAERLVSISNAAEWVAIDTPEYK